ncbi:LysR family transcriptional regulator, hydrogen peroxide-inducible genes activator [Cnuella takakiae]|uniref:LysR family transcriptional regulator, hydrogen peroxide-inducible genes activator n=1 Tax=Cnuella takakiae TaxID=1302690 RepID=A0A1M4VLM5_9BACT|nr:hydrogen peroxide-inducible genes activator [Cnuella takakiae]OLY92559.1 hydrogen peroxide-inducible genes activator [Cnuella takakiae]SHE69924.1 LysR family transcriptional regulator, hydrogen peroxide-inducible genes activator [Cnuella takakiae]
MNLQQLEYIVAVDQQRHFARAAETCFVTQATLSMMIRKLEDELDVVIFDRSRQPVVPTEVGRKIIDQARVVLKEAALLRQVTTDASQQVSGVLRLGIIPTLAPYLLPHFLKAFLAKYPQVQVRITEMNTAQIVEHLSQDKLDVGLMATPLPYDGLRTEHLFLERFYVFTSQKEKDLKKKFVLPEEIDVNRLWLLQEGHCMRSQMLNLCRLKKESAGNNLEYEAGSIETLLQIVEMRNGLTIVPELATIHFDEQRKNQLKEFKAPIPVREVSLVTYRHFIKTRLLEALKEEIVNGVKPVLAKAAKEHQVIEVR